MNQKDTIPTYDQAIEALKNDDDQVLEKALLVFDIEDCYYVEQVTNAIRTLLKRTDLTPSQIVGVGHALHGLGRLPLRTPGLDIHISLAIKGEGGAEEYELYFTEDQLLTTSGGYIDSGHGSDSFSGTTYSVEVGYREYEGFGIAIWPEVFSEMTAAELKVEDCSDDSLVDWKHPDGSEFWEWIANHD
jgi:hypothetical protein